ncbi:MAG: hypothetical protein ACP5QR_14975 [Rhizomicrobium sp.]
MSKATIKITHQATGSLLAEGPVGWGITPFEGNYYIRRQYLKDGAFKANYVPGFCPYKFLYVWMDWLLPNGELQKSLGWMYWLPNPLFPFIWFRVAVPANHPSLCYESHNTAS